MDTLLKIEVVPKTDRLLSRDGDHWDVIFQWTPSQSTKVTLTTDQVRKLHDEVGRAIGHRRLSK